MTEQALVLVGGFGTRLKSIFPETAKPLVPIAGRPFLDILLESLRDQGIREVVLLTHFKSEEFAGYVQRESEFKLRIKISQEDTPLGSAGALLNCAKIHRLDEQFLVANGDTFFTGSLNHFLGYKLLPKELACLGICEVTDVSRYGEVQFNDKDVLQYFSEKGKAGRGWVNSGLCLLSKDVLDLIPPNRFQSLEQDIFPQCKSTNRVLRIYKLEGEFIDIGLPASYEEFNLKMTLHKLEIQGASRSKQGLKDE